MWLNFLSTFLLQVHSWASRAKQPVSMFGFGNSKVNQQRNQKLFPPYDLLLLLVLIPIPHIGTIRYTLFETGFPQAVYDLKRRIGLTGTRSHH